MKKECIKIREIIDESGFRELVPDEISALATHLDACSACRKYREKSERLGELLMDFRDSELRVMDTLSPDIEDLVMERILPRKRVPFLRFAVGIAFILIVFVNTMLYLSGPGAGLPVQEKTAPLYASVTGNGNYYINNDGKWVKPESSPLSLPFECRSSAFTTVTIALGDICSMQMRPNTLVRVSRDGIDLISGKALFDFEKLDSPFYLSHEFGTVTILGTRLVLETGRDYLRVSLIEGRIEVSNRFGKAVLEAGQETKLGPDTINISAFSIAPAVLTEVENWDGREFLLDTGTEVQSGQSPVQGSVPDIEQEFIRLKGLEAPD